MKSKSIIRIIIFIIAALLIIAASLFFWLGKRVVSNPAGTVGNTAGNLNNAGLFCERDGVVYFANGYDSSSLYSMNADETNIKKLNSVSVAQINAGSNNLYYFQYGSGGGKAGLGYIRTMKGLYGSNLKGKNSVCFNSETIFNIQLVNDTLYYLMSDEKGPHFYRAETNNSEPVLLADAAINPSCVYDSVIYYNGTEEDHSLYALDSSDTVTTIWNGNIWNPIVTGDYVYYMDISNNYRLCRYSLSMDQIEVLTNDRIDYYNLNDSYIYYQKSSSTEPALKRMALDGSNVETVSEGIYENINITSQYVYFNAYGASAPMYKTPAYGSISVSTFDAAREAALSSLQ